MIVEVEVVRITAPLRRNVAITVRMSVTPELLGHCLPLQSPQREDGLAEFLEAR